MMTVSPLAVDVDHLRRTLAELGYKESISPDSAPLVHHILTDLSQATDQYTKLLQHYDELFERWQDEHTVKGSSTNLELTHLSGLDSSMLGSQNFDESFMLRTVEEARGKIDALASELDQLKDQNTTLRRERELMAAELQKSHATAQELSQLLQSKHVQQETLQFEVSALKKSNETGIAVQLASLVKTTIGMLSGELQPVFTAKLCDSVEGMVNLLSEVVVRLRREMESKALALKEAKDTADKLRKDHENAEESSTKIKSLVTMYQSQIADLMTQLHQKEFEKSLQSDIASQIAVLENINNMIKEKVSTMERIKHEGTNGATGEMAQMTVDTLLESLSAELNTEICFSGHLSQLVDKLNKRRAEQDQDISQLSNKLRESEGKVAEAEGEKTSLKSKMDKLASEMATKDSNVAAGNEVIRSLQQALESKQTKIEEQKKLKTALEQCQLSMMNMRKNEDMIRQHILAQDEEIKRLKIKLTQIEAEKTKMMQRCSEIESELNMIKTAFKERTEEVQRLTSELKYAINSQEKAQMELKSANDHIKELEDLLASKRKEKDLLMTTYCRVIKDNERLHADLQNLHEDLVASRAGDVQSESTLKAFQAKLQAQAQEIERYRTQIGQSETKIVEINGKLEETQRSKKRIEEETGEKNREISSLKGIVSSLERSKKDIAAQMARFGQQAADLRNHLRRIEEERAELQDKLKKMSASDDSPNTRGLHSQLMTLTMELDQVRSRLRAMEREKDSLAHQLQVEKIKSDKMEEMMNQERNKRIEKESLIDNLEVARNKLKEEVGMLNREHDKGVKSVRRQLISSMQERSRRNHESYIDGFVDKIPETTPSPPASPTDEGKLDSTERLKTQNRLLKKHLTEIRNEMKETLSPGRLLNPELETSIIALTSDETDQLSSPTSDEIVFSNAEIKRRLEHENKLLFKIVDKVKSELMKAGLDTPRSITV